MSERLDTLIEGAIEWAEAGVPVFPCKSDKSPLTENGHLDGITDTTKIRALFEFYGDAAEYVGAVMGKESGLFAVDFDTYKPGAEAYYKGLEEQGLLPATRTHRTKNGGLHLIYKGAEQPNCKPHDATEVKGDGGYIIVPPSPGYEVLREGVRSAPKGLIAEFQAARRARSMSSDDNLRSDILTAGVFHESLTQLAARMSSRGMDQLQVQQELMKLMEASVAASPHHSRHARWASIMRGAEIARIVKSGHAKFNPAAASALLSEAVNNPTTEAIGAALFAPSPTVGDEPEEVVYHEGEWPFGADEGYFAHEERDVTSAKFAMFPIYAENETVVIFAEPKTGKTAIALTTALHVACGLDFGSFKVHEAGPVLYYGLEGRRAIELRVESWKRHMVDEGQELPKHIPMFTVTKPVNFLREEARKTACDQIIAADRYSKTKEGKPLKVVFIDTLTKAMSGGDQNSVEDTSHLFDLVSQLRLGGMVATVVFVHHKSRQGAVRGSTNIEAEPDVLLDVSKSESTVEMSIARARSIEDGMRFRFTLHGYDLGITDQGFQQSGLYVKAVEGIDGSDATHDMVHKLDHAERLKVLVSSGVGPVAAGTFLTMLREADPALIPKPVGRAAPKKPYPGSAHIQEMFHELVPEGGTLFGGYAIYPAKDGAKIVAFQIAKVSSTPH